MSLVEWKNDYSVGVVEIDNQHQKIVVLINRLFDAMKQGKANNVLGPIINDLVIYAQTHFKTEEKYFAAFKYQNEAEHQAIHQSFVKEITKFKSDFESGKITLSIGVLNFLKDWLDKHILGEDMKYVDCFKQNGLK
jgi:hemerythrin